MLIMNQDYLEIKKYIKESGFTSRVLIEEYAADTIFENLRNLIWDDVHCVVVIMTKDDEMLNGMKRARQNVVFELGYCFGAFDSLADDGSYLPKDALIILAEKDVELFADINGLTRMVFERGKIEEKKEFIIDALKRCYKKAKPFYDL